MVQKTILVQVIIALLAVAVSAGLLMYTRILDPVWNPFRVSAEKVLEKTAEKMQKETSFHGEAVLSLFLKNQTDLNFSGELKSDVNLEDPDSPKQANAFNLVLAMEGTQYTLEGQSIVIGDDTYLKINAIPLEISLILSFVGIDINDIKGQWIDLGKDSLMKLYEKLGLTEEDLETAVKESKEGRAQLMDVLKGVLENKNLYSIKEELPNEKIAAKDAYHYLIALDKDGLKEAAAYILDNSDDEENSVLSPFTNVGQARIKAREALLTANMRQLQTAAELIHSKNGSYANFNCDNQDYTMTSVCESILKETGSNPVFYAEKDSYCAYSSFLKIEGYSYCIDSFGRSYATKDVKDQGYCNSELIICPPKQEAPQELVDEMAREEVLKGFSDFLEKVGEITAEVWIGTKDNLLYRLKMEKEINLSQFEEEGATLFSEEGSLLISLDVNFSEFGKTKEIIAPETSKTAEDLFSGGTLSPVNSAQKSARDARRKADLRQMVAAMELYYNDYGKYLQSNKMPSVVGSYMFNVPVDPATGEPYFWLDNTRGTCGGGQLFCAWADLENGSYYLASERGNREVSAVPTGCPC